MLFVYGAAGTMTGMLHRWSGAVRVMLRSHPTYAGNLDCVRAVSNIPTQSNNSAKPSLKKPKTPQGRFDETEQTVKDREPLERFPDDINPITKEKGGPKGPEPTRYGDWERKGRCIDF